MKEKYEDINNLENIIEEQININTVKIQNQDKYQKEYEKLNKQYDNTLIEIDKLNDEINLKNEKRLNTEDYIKFLKCQDDIIKDFNKLYWNILLDQVVIENDRNIRGKFTL